MGWANPLPHCLYLVVGASAVKLFTWRSSFLLPFFVRHNTPVTSTHRLNWAFLFWCIATYCKTLSKLCYIVHLLLHVLPGFFSLSHLAPAVFFLVFSLNHWKLRLWSSLWKREKLAYFNIITQYNNYWLYYWSIYSSDCWKSRY